MRPVRIRRIRASAAPQDAARLERIARRVIELLGRQLAEGDAVMPVPKLSLEIPEQPGLTEEQMARCIARSIAQNLG
jgi:hypothetical protein